MMRAARNLSSEGETSAGAEDDERKQVEGRIKVRKPIASRGLEHIDAVDVEILLPGVRDDAPEAVRQHTRERSGEQDGAERDENDHKRRPEDGIDVIHRVEADVARAEENFGQDPRHAVQRERVSADEERWSGSRDR